MEEDCYYDAEGRWVDERASTSERASSSEEEVEEPDSLLDTWTGQMLAGLSSEDVRLIDVEACRRGLAMFEATMAASGGDSVGAGEEDGEEATGDGGDGCLQSRVFDPGGR